MDILHKCAVIFTTSRGIRGPIVYCLESIDLPKEVLLEDICLPAGAKWKTQHKPDLLGGVTVLTTKALVLKKATHEDIGGKSW